MLNCRLRNYILETMLAWKLLYRWFSVIGHTGDTGLSGERSIGLLLLLCLPNGGREYASGDSKECRSSLGDIEVSSLVRLRRPSFTYAAGGVWSSVISDAPGSLTRGTLLLDLSLPGVDG